MKTIYFIRHAESQANAGEATQSDASICLTEKGEQQAITLAHSIIEKPDLIICSKYCRTEQTAAPLVRKFPFVPVKILPLHEFTYLSPGACAGTTHDQRKTMVREYWEKAGPAFVHGPGAESFNQFIQRIDHALEAIEFCEARHILVFTHGHVLRAIWQQLMQVSFPSEQARFRHFHQSMSHLSVPNTCVFKAIFQKNQWEIVEPLPIEI